MIGQAARYWTRPGSQAWEGNSHWRSGIPREWERVGTDHLDLFDKLAGVLDAEPSTRTVVEWGCGGGANAVAFAPRAERFIGVDVVQESVDECERSTRAVCSTPFVPVLIDIERPEEAVERIGRDSVGLFLCLYVMELLPSRAYAERVLGIAREVLASSGVLFVQIKYRHTGRRSLRKRRYEHNVASQTIFSIDGFWQVATAAGFQPQVVSLVPENDLDRNYAYFLLTPAVAAPG